MAIEEKLKEIPSSPGVYLHKDAAGKVIYVGKAKNLRSRVDPTFAPGLSTAKRMPSSARLRISSSSSPTTKSKL